MILPLKTKVFGREFHFFSELGSTQDIAHTLATQGVPEGTVVVAATQTQGRGRHSREWVSPKGGLWFSLVLLPHLKPEEVTPIPLIFAYGIKKELDLHLSSSEYEVKIKWPNDVIIKERSAISGRKIAGILSELYLAPLPNIIRFLIVGIGINLNVEPSLLMREAISLKELLNKDVDMINFFSNLLLRLEWLYLTFLTQKNIDWLKEEINSSLILVESRVILKETPTSSIIEGKLIGVDSKGNLLINTGEGEFAAVNCYMLRPV